MLVDTVLDRTEDNGGRPGDGREKSALVMHAINPTLAFWGDVFTDQVA